MKTGLTKKQKVTELYYNAKDPIAEIYTHDTKLKRRLLEYAAKFPELCRLTEDDEQGGLRFEITKERISIRLTAPYSEERRSNARKWAKEMDCGVNTMERSERKRKTEKHGRKPLGTNGALLYMVCDHVVRPAEPTAQALECPGLFVAMLRTRGCTPCAALRLSLPK